MYDGQEDTLESIAVVVAAGCRGIFLIDQGMYEQPSQNQPGAR
jgi:hypothetical protein